MWKKENLRRRRLCATKKKAGSQSARTQSTLRNGERLEERIVLNAAPVLDDAASPALLSIAEDAGAPVGQVGTFVSSLIDTSGTHNNFSDTDGDLPGIAITGVNLQGGALWYSTDNGSTWLDVGAVSDEAPRLLAADATTRVYFEPTADFTGTVSDVISFKAWDRNVIWQQLGLDIDGEAAGDNAGDYVAFSADGQTVAIGARHNSANGLSSGHVRIYSWTGISWSQVGVDIDGDADGDRLGYSVSLSADGQTVAIGAPGNDSGYVRIYSWTGSSWSKLGADIDGEAVSDGSGAVVSLSADGQTVAVGAPHNDANGSSSGHVRIYSWDGLGWNQLGSDIDGEFHGDEFGFHASLSADGQTIAIGARFHNVSTGHVRIYTWDGSAWNQLGTDIDGEASANWFGKTVSLSADGRIVAIGAFGNDGNGSDSGHVRIYEWTGSSWIQVGGDIDGEASSDHSGWSVSLSADGALVAIGAQFNDGFGNGTGQIRIYSWDGFGWNQLGSDIDAEAIGDRFGYSVSLSADGETVAIGAGGNDGNGPNSGHVRVFQRVPSVSATTDTLGITVESVNDTPVWPPVTVSTNEDTTKVITLNATDVDSTTLTYAVTSQPSHGTVSIVNDKATYVPNTNFYGTDSFVVMVSDNHPTQPKATTALVTVNVDAVNDVPLLDALSDTTISEDAAEQTVSLTGIATGASEDQPLRVTATSDNAGLIPDPTVTYTSPNATGSIAFTPVADEHGSATITVTVEDGGLDQNLATSEDNATVSQTFTVTVVSVMDRPVLDTTASPQLVPVIEDSGVPVGAIGTRVSDLVNTGGVVGNFSDVDGDLAGIAITAVNPNGVLWCSFDNGARWSQAVGVSEATPRLLVATSSSRLYFEPNDDFSGSITDAITFRAWDRTDSGWGQLGSDIDAERNQDQLGHSVSVSADGQTVAIGAPYNQGSNGSNSGHVRIYSWTGSGWSKLGADIDGEAGGDLSGYSVSLSADGQTVAIGANYNDDNGNNSGHVRIYSWTGSSWSKLGADINGEAADDRSGESVSLSADGQTVAIGANYNDDNGNNSGHVRIYSWDGSGWSKLGADIDGEAGGDLSGYSVSLSADGQTVAIGAPYNQGSNGSNSGHVRIYSWTGSGWSKLGADIDGEAGGDLSGSSVSLSADGQTVAIGARTNDGNPNNSGHVRVYSWTGSSWSKLGSDIDGEAHGDESGSSISLSADGRTVAIGAPHNDGNGSDSGHVRIYSWDGATWVKLGSDIDGEAYQDFSGSSVSLSADGQTVVIGAYGNDGNGSWSGHARIYRLNLDRSVSLATDTAGLNVVPLNDWPVLSDVTATTDEEVPVEITLEANDVDSGSFTYAVTGDPANGTVSLVGNVATYTPATDFYGTDTFTVTVSDNHPTNPNTDTATVTVNVANLDNETSPWGYPLLPNPQGNWLHSSGSGPSQSSSWYPTGLPSAESLTVHGYATYNHEAAPGWFGQPQYTSSHYYVFETYVHSDVTQDIDFILGGNDGHSLFVDGAFQLGDGFGNNNATGTLSLVADVPKKVTLVSYNSGGDTHINFLTADNRNIEDVSGITISAVPYFRAPTLDPISSVTIAEDASQQVISLTGISAGANETQSLRVTASSSDPSLIPDPTPTYTGPDATGSIAFTPRTDQHGTATISVTVEDGGLDNDLATVGDNRTTTKTFDVTVTPVNDLPVLDSAASPQLDWVLTNAGAPTGQVGTLVSKLIEIDGLHNNFSDVDGDLPGIAITGVNLQGGALWYSSDDGSTWLDVGAVSDEAPRLLAADATTRVYFEPAADFSGTVSDVISFKVWDRSLVWQQLGLDIDGEAGGDSFGWSVSMTSDGQTIAIGAQTNDSNGSNAGQVRVYSWDGSGWNQRGDNIDGELPESRSGRSVSLSADGETLAVGAYWNSEVANLAGHVRIYSWNGSNWTQLGVDLDGEEGHERFGYSVSLSGDGQTVVIGGMTKDVNGTDSGHAQIYSWDGLAWNQRGAGIDGEFAGDWAGCSVSVSEDGQTVAIGAYRNDGNGIDSGHVRLYLWDGSAWNQLGADIDGEAADDRSGWSVSLSADGRMVAIGALQNDGNGDNSGHVRIYSWDGSAWIQVGDDIDGETAGDLSGWFVSLSADGQTVAIGAPHNDGNGGASGHVRIYSWTGSAWMQIGDDIDGRAAQNKTAPNHFSSDGRLVVVGAFDGNVNGTDPGHVRVFQFVPSVSTTTDTLGITVESVNDTPVWPPVTVSTNEDTTKVITLNATDVDSTTLTYAVTSQPSHGTVSIVNDKATYVPNTNFYGTDSFVVMVSDNHPTQPKATTALVTVNVDAVNDVPLLDALSDTTISEDAAEQTVSLTGINTGASEDQPLRVTATSDNAGLIPDPTVTYTSPNATGSIAFTPVADEHGSATITVTVEDGGLDQNLATSEDNATVSQTFTVTVVSVMDRPVLDTTASPQLVPVIEDSGVPVGAIGTRVSDLVNTGGVVGNFSDVDGDLAGIAITAVNPNGVLWCSFDNGARWSQAVGVSEATPRLLVATSSSRLYFEPNDDFSGSITDAITFRAWDRTDSGWGQLGSDIDAERNQDQLGHSVSVSADGQTVAIGAPYNQGSNGSNSGHVRIYSWTGSGWSKLGADIDGEAGGDLSGYSVSLSADGQTVAIGANYNDDNGNNSGHVRIYSWTGSSWSKLGADINGEAADDRSGESVSLSADGQTVAIGANYNDDNGNNSGHVRIYSWDGSGWSKLGADIDGEAGGDLSGYSVSLSADGQTVAIGAPYNQGSNGSNSGHVRIYSWTGSGWSKLGADIDGEAGGDLSGSSVSLSADGQTVAIGARTNDGNPNNSGHVRVYSWTGSSWSKLGSDIDGEAHGDESGSSISLSADGRTVAIGAPHNDGNGSDSGHVRIYSWDGATWVKLGSDIDGEAYQDFSGSSVSLSADGQTVVIGAYGNDGNGSWSGHARIYRLNLDRSVSLATDTAGLNVVPLNDWPVLSDVTATTDEEVPVEITLEANDVDSGSFTYAVTGDPANGTVSLVGNVATYTPATDFYGTDTFTVTVSDNHPTNPNTDTATVTVNVANINDQPAFNELVDLSISEDAGEQTVFLDGISSGSGETQVLSVTAVSDNPGLIPDPTVTYASPDATGSIAFTPVADQFGTATITVTLEDGGIDNNLSTPEDNGSILRTVTVIVAPVNDEPTLDVLPDVNLTEDDPEQVVSLTGISAGGDEIQVVSVTAVSDNPGLIPNPTVTYTTAATTGSIALTPVADAHGTATITVTLEDGGPDDDLGTSEDNGLISRTVVVNVAPVNDLPTLAIEGAFGSQFTGGAETAPNGYPLEQAEEGNWLYSSGPSGTASTTYYPTSFEDFSDVVDHGYVSYYTEPGDTTVGRFTPPDNSSGQYHVFETYVISDVEQTVSYWLRGNDGVSLFVDDAFVSGGGFGVENTGDITFQAGVARKIVLAGHNGNSQTNVTFRVNGGRLEDVNGLYTSAVTRRVENALEQTVSMTGISAGGSETQEVRITAVSDSTNLIPDPTVDFDSQSSTGNLKFTPVSGQSGVVAITVTAEDGGLDNDLATPEDNGVINRTVIVKVDGFNDAPVLDPAASPQLASVLEDAAAPSGQVGSLVSDLIDAGGTHNNFSDVDGDLPGIAITGVNLQGGSLWYSIDDGSTWIDVGAVSNAVPRLLAADATTRLYFQPAANFNGTISDVISFKAWDRITAGWEQLGLDIDGEAAGDHSGNSISLSSDGQTIAVAAYLNDGTGESAGHVRIYRWNNSAWNQLGSDIDGEAAGDESGASVSLSADGQVVAIGANRNDGNGTDAGHVRVYRWDGSVWNQLGSDIDGELIGDRSGLGVAISADGQTVAIGAEGNDGNGTDAGHVRIYQWNNSVWQQLGNDIDGEATGDESGRRVSVSDDGYTVAIAARYNDSNGSNSGHVRIYQWSGIDWQQVGIDINGEYSGDESGFDVSLSSDGQTVAISAWKNDGNGFDSGHVRVFEWSGSSWLQLGNDIDGEASRDDSGRSLALSSNGKIVVIGATHNDGNGYNSGHVRIYSWNGSSWGKLGEDIDGEASEDYSGLASAISADGQRVAISAWSNAGNGVNSGHVRIFRLASAPDSLSTTTDTISVTVDPQNDAPTGDVTIDGSATQNAVLSANTSTVQDEDGLGAFAYEWLRDGVPISAATSSTYTLTQDDVNAQVSVRVDYTDNEGTAESLTSAQTSAVVNVNDAPVLDPAASPGLASVLEDATAPAGQVGSLVSDLIDAGGTHNNFSDVDGDLPGIAITGVNLQGGSLWFSNDDGGTWLDVGAVSDAVPRLLAADATTRVYFQPAANFNGTISDVISFKAWDRITAGWQQLGLDIDGEAAGDSAGWSCTISRDGSTVAVGSRFNDDNGIDSGHVRVFRWNSTSWEQVGAAIAGENAGDTAGYNVALSADGSTVAIGASENNENGSRAGHVRIFGFNGTSWEQFGDDIDGEAAGDISGNFIDLSADGETVAIGARWNDGNGDKSGHVRVYRLINSSWQQLGEDINGLSAGDWAGYTTLSDDGYTVAIGGPHIGGNGNVRILRFDGNQWSQVGETIFSSELGDQTGIAMSLSTDGSVIAIGSPYHNGITGKVCIYRLEDSTWSQLGSDIYGESSGDAFGHYVSLSSDGTIVAVGTQWNDTNGTDAGQVSVYQLANGSWQQVEEDILGESAGDEAGHTISLSGDGTRVVIGARYNDGVNGTDSGHVRIFRLAPAPDSLSTATDTISVTVDPQNDAPSGSVTVNGVAEEDQVLTATNDLADIDGLGVIANEWSRDGAAISGATASTYTLTQDDVGSTITAAARYTDNDGTVETVTSSATSPVLNVNDAPTGDVTIDGSATQNAVLSANTSTVQDEDGLGAFAYQWLRDGVPIAAATSSTYTLTQDDVDSQISVQVDYTDNEGAAETLPSAQTSAVVNVNDAPVLGGNRTIHYPDFSDTTGLIFEGRAAQYGDVLRVHDNTPNTNGVIEFDGPVQVLDGFETDFTFRVGDEMTSSGADNLSFAMYGRDGQRADPWARHSLHFMIDTWNNPEHEFDENNWSLQIIGQSPDLVPNSAKGGYVFHVVPLPGVKDTELHDVRIAYDPKIDSLVVTFDDVEILSADSQEIGSFLQTLLEQVDAGVSIWASSGGVSETHDIHSWSFTSRTPPALNPMVEDAGVPVGTVGALVTDLLGNRFSDIDGDSPGIAITGVNLQGGTLWYSIDDGATWLDVGAVSDADPRLLAADANARVYFEPNADFSGSISDVISFKAWDRNVEWTQLGLDIDGEGTDDMSGNSVSFSSDGTTVAIGARRNQGADGSTYRAGHTRIFRLAGGEWTQLGEDINGEAEQDADGWSVSISADGNSVAIGSKYSDSHDNSTGRVRVFNWDGSSWIQKGSSITGANRNDQLGGSVSLSNDGLTVGVGARLTDNNGISSGASLVYKWTGSSWDIVGQPINGSSAFDEAGHAVALSKDGLTIVVGAPFHDANGTDSGQVRAFKWDGGAWQQQGQDILGINAGDEAGHAVAISEDGTTLAVGSHRSDLNGDNSGSVRIFKWDGANWNLQGEQLSGQSADASFGQSITLSSDGDTIAIGAPANWDAGLPYDSEPVRVFRWNGSEWLQFGNDILQEAANDRSGFSVSLSGAGDSLAIGAIGNNGSFPGAGHTRIYGLADTGNSRSFETETVSVEVMSINDAPTFNAIADRVLLEDSQTQTIDITGITAGGGENQPLQMTVTSSNSSLISEPTITSEAVSVEGSRSLAFAPLPHQYGIAQITVTLEDGGLDLDLNTAEDNALFSRTFDVTVTPDTDNPPSPVTPHGRMFIHETLSGDSLVSYQLPAINVNGEAINGLPNRVAVTSSNTALIPDPTVLYASADVPSSLSFTPVSSANGTATLSIQVEDGGPDNDFATTEDNRQATHQVEVNVLEVISNRGSAILAKDSTENLYVNTQPVTYQEQQAQTNIAGFAAIGATSEDGENALLVERGSVTNRLVTDDAWRINGLFESLQNESSPVLDLSAREVSVDLNIVAVAGAYEINGARNPTLIVRRGQIYNFKLDVANHPFFLQTTGNGSQPENRYNKFFQGQGRTEGEHMWIVPADAPDELYYQCEFHPVMFGKIIVVD